jgi:3-oxoacyl-[acyl-carrier protein] reductase
MADKIERFLSSSAGSAIAAKLGLVVPTLNRFEKGTGLPMGEVVVSSSSAKLQSVLSGLGLTIVSADSVDTKSAVQDASSRCDALILDGRDYNNATDLAGLHEFFSPLVRRLNNNGRIIVIASPHLQANNAQHAAAQKALEGFTRSIAKEIGSRGSTAQLWVIESGADAGAGSTLSYLLSSKSAFIDGQAIRIHATKKLDDRNYSLKPLSGKLAIVTGASRGIGESIARTLARDGATVLGVDIPPAEEALQAVMASIQGHSIAADITADDAPAAICAKAKALGGADIVVHNAGVTRDKLLVNMDKKWWDMTLDINLGAAQRINDALLSDGLNDNGRIIGGASMVGISGQRGQTNYSASKAGVIGYVDYMATDSKLKKKGITVNGVAPGFIETQMTATIPVLTREVARRLNSLSQGGQPEDVAEAIAWLAQPGSAGVNGTTLRVCGQNWIGA